MDGKTFMMEDDSEYEGSAGAIKFNNNRLSYIGQDVRKIPPVLSKLYGSRVQSLDLSYNCLTSLQELSNFPHLNELVLDNNQLTDSITFPRNENLRTLSLNKNNITDLDVLMRKLENNLPNLRYLSLLGNKACPNQLSSPDKDDEDYQRYRYYVLYCLPNLQFLDSRAVTTEERTEACQRGKFMKVVRPSSENESNRREEIEKENRNKYTPLPAARRHADDHRGMFGKCRFRYAGKHSEGNRFILNDDL
ncbi:leucine-rich melanocyte differentiation-associated protein-like isoform X2 [Lycorma delicatula]|uniref:leucine-rich melanocyte differentiation-associated protein-like isoform X2 n=1 Tax=Lycorma delicatula TaxID=130591 RepID=UPI003F50DA7D